MEAVKVIRLATCKCTNGGAKQEHEHSGGGQFQGSRLLFCPHTAAKVRSGSGVVLVAGGGKEKKQGETQVTGVSVCKYLCSESIEIY